MHTIRLREPWQSSWIDTAELQGRAAVYERKFHRPNGLEASQVVELVVSRRESHADAISVVHLALNDHSILDRDDKQADHQNVTSVAIEQSLTAFNQIALTVAFHGQEASQEEPLGLSEFAEVALRISE